MRKLFFISLLFAFLSGGCSDNNEQISTTVYNADEIKEIVQRAMRGDSYSNHLIKRLIDVTLPFNKDYKEFNINQVKLNGEDYYSLIIKFNNPVYNRFAIYDMNLNLYLNDKSLNGNIFIEYIKIDNKDFIQVKDEFLTKDEATVERLSLYGFDESNLKLLFRSPVKYQKGEFVMLQSIVHLNIDSIMTSINAPRNIRKDIYYDLFHYNPSLKRFASVSNHFEKFISEEIKKSKHNSELYLISDKASGIESTGIVAHKDTSHIYNNYKNRHFNFSLTLSDGWQIQDKVMITKQLQDSMEGAVFINNELGATISVVRLPLGTDASYFINYPLVNQKESFYILRYSSKIEVDNSYYFFFEIICGEKNFLLMLETSKTNYEANKQHYLSIINSFGMEC